MDELQTVPEWQSAAVSVSLTRKQLKALEGLLSCQRVEDAAKNAGISERTLFRWLKKPEFQAVLQFAIRETTMETLRRLVVGKDKALDTLEELLDAESESVQRNAAKDWLDFTYQHLELQNINVRLSEIERLLEERK